MKKKLIIALIVLAPLLVACKRVVAPSVPKAPLPQEPAQQVGSCVSAEVCPVIKLACVPGFEPFNDPSNPSCACGCRPRATAADNTNSKQSVTPTSTNAVPRCPQGYELVCSPGAIIDGRDTTTCACTPQKSEQGPSADKTSEVSYSGSILAGSKSLVLDFNQSDYEKALAAKKNIVLYFYASWCPICRREVPDMYAAFNSLNDESLVAFRVNYNDSDTDNDEVALARQFGVPYQHTKVFLKNGERILKSPEAWDKQRYLNEISKAF